MLNTGTLLVSTPTEREIVLTRVFDAPRQMVFDAMTKPDLLKRWFGPRGWSLRVCEVDLRVGGAWRFVLSGPDGNEMSMHGVYREINSPARSVHTETIDPFAVESIVTTVLVESGGKTTLTGTILYRAALALRPDAAVVRPGRRPLRATRRARPGTRRVTRGRRPHRRR